MGEETLKSAQTYGLGVVLAVGMAFFMGWLIRFILKENSKREERLAGIIERDLVSLRQAQNEAADKFIATRERIEEAARRNREEHERLEKNQSQIADGLQILILRSEEKH